MGIWGLNYVFSLEYIKLYLFMGYVVEDNQLWKLVSLDKDFFFFFFFFFLAVPLGLWDLSSLTRD